MSINIQDREPNFRSESGRLFLVRCFVCNPVAGKENYLLSVASGQCVFCGWFEDKEAELVTNGGDLNTSTDK